MRKNPKPYLTVVDGQQLGFFKAQDEALNNAYKYRLNFARSLGEEKVYLPIKIVYDQIGEPQRTVHEE